MREPFVTKDTGIFVLRLTPNSKAWFKALFNKSHESKGSPPPKTEIFSLRLAAQKKKKK